MSANHDEKRVNELREMLRGLTWGAFVVGSYEQNDSRNEKTLNGVSFVAKAGLFLNRNVFAIMAEGYFVAIAPILSRNENILNPLKNWDILIANQPHLGINPADSLPWTSGDRNDFRRRYIIGPTNTLRRSAVEMVGTAEGVLPDLAD